MQVSAPRRRAAVALCAAVVVAYALVLQLRPGGPWVTQAFDDLGEGIAAGIAAIPCILCGLRSAGRWRLSWMLIAGGLFAWSVGEFIWSYYELVGSRETPFPSLADAGFLLFPVLCLAGLLVRPYAAFVGRARARVLLDGIMVVGSLFILSWTTSLGAVYHAGAQNWFAWAVSLAYPGSDLVLIAVAVLVTSRAHLNAGLVLLISGLVSMAIADSAFTYLVAAGTYGTGALTDVAWVAAFLAIGVSALFPTEAAGEKELRTGGSAALALPYVVLFAGTVTMFVAVVRKTDTPLTFTVETVAIVALLLRQLIVLLDNRRLTLDVMAQKDELAHRAFHDPLTGLANRALFYDRVAHALDLHRRDRRPVSVMFVDLDDFKAVNDAFGHDAGDAVLAGVAERLREVVRTGDTVARLGGDEFAVLLEDDGDPAGIAARLLDALATPVRLGDRLIPVRASIGSSTIDPDQNVADSQELLRQADVAMYSAKRGGKGTAVRYAPGLHSLTTDDLEQRMALSEDVQAGRVGVAFQPIARTNSGELYAMEALARWQYRGAPVTPAEFIPLADRGGFLGDLDLVVARRALEFANEHQSPALIVSTNLGLRRLAEHDLPRRLGAMLAEFGIAPHRLVVEVSEQADLDEAAIAEALGELRALGVGLAIDDFGVGYSNLSRLEVLQPDVVKLDRAFVAPLSDSRPAGKLLRRVIELAHDLGAIVVGEGVETQHQRDVLAELGCDAVQGYLIGRPATSAAEVA